MVPLYDDLKEEQKEEFLKAVGELCSKSVNMYSLIREYIHKYNEPLPVAPYVYSTATPDGELITYKKQKDENTKKSPGLLRTLFKIGIKILTGQTTRINREDRLS